MAEANASTDGGRRGVDAASAGRLVIRAGRPDDIASVHATILKLAEEIGAGGYVTSTPDDLMRNAFGATKKFAVEIAEVDGAFAGMCLHFPIFSTWMGGSGVYVQDLYVEAAFRRLKVGDALLRHVAEAARAEGAIYLRLAVDTDNSSAQRFYERLGIRRAEYEQVHKVTGPAFVAFCEGGDVHAAIEMGKP